MSSRTAKSPAKRKRSKPRKDGNPSNWQTRKNDLITFLQDRSANSFLHEQSTQEEVLFAAIMEVKKCKLQAEVLERELTVKQQKQQLFQQQHLHRQLQLQLTSTSQPQQSTQPVQRFNSLTSFLGFSAFPQLSSTFDLSSPTVDSGSSSSQSLLDSSPIQSPDEGLFCNDSQPSSEDSQRSSSSDDASVAEFTTPAAAAKLLPPSSTSLVSPSIYRDSFRASDIYTYVLSPDLRFVDASEYFVTTLPFLTLGELFTVESFLARNFSLYDILPQPILAITLQSIGAAIQLGECHCDGTVVVNSPRITVDCSTYVTYDSPSASTTTTVNGPRKIRYITIVRRGINKPKVDLMEARRILLGPDLTAQRFGNSGHNPPAVSCS